MTSWFILLLPVSLSSAAQLLIPSGCLPADGGPPVALHLYVPEDGRCEGTVVARAGKGRFEKAECVAPSLFRLWYAPARLKAPAETRIAAEWLLGGEKARTERKVDLCPHPAGSVVVKATPATLVALEGKKALLDISAFGPDGKPLEAPRLSARSNVGRIESLRRTGLGHYQAYYIPPTDPYPQVGIVMVASPDGARFGRVAAGRVVIPITASVNLPGRTKPGTRIVMKVAGKKFGPVVADAKGRFEIPILVPPGVNTGIATSIDRAGNRASRRINLYLPETNQLGLWAHPLMLPADGTSRARLLVTTVTASGVPADLGKVVIKARRGAVSALRRIARGLLEAYYTAPQDVGSGTDVVEVRFPKGGKKSRAKVEITLLPGRAEFVDATLPSSVPADPSRTFHARVKVLDSERNVLRGKYVQARMRYGKVTRIDDTEKGYVVEFVPPIEAPRWRDRLTIEVRERHGRIPASIVVTPESLVPAGEGSPALAVCLVNDSLKPVPSQTLVRLEPGPRFEAETDEFGCSSIPILEEGLKVGRPARYRIGCEGCSFEREVFVVKEPDGIRLLPAGLDSQAVAGKVVSFEFEIELYPPAGLEVLVDAVREGDEFLVKARAVGPDGKPAPGARIVLEASGGKLAKIGAPAGGATFAWKLRPGKRGWSSIVLTATEITTGAGAVLVLEEGK